MKKNIKTKNEVANNVVHTLRQYGINHTLFRHTVAKSVGLNITDMECLDLLFHKGISTPSDLCKLTGLTSGAASIMLDRLEKNKLIKRQPNLDDKRGKRIIVNPAGAAKIVPFFTSIRSAQNKLLASYSAEDLQLIEKFLSEVADVWENEYKKL